MSEPRASTASLDPKKGTSELWFWLPGLALLLATVLIVLLTRSEWQKILNEVEATSITTAEILAEHSDRLLETTDLVRIQVAEVVDDGTVTADRGQFEQLGRLTNAVPYITSIWIGDAEGQATLTSREFPAPSISAADREYFAVVRDVPDTLFIGILIDNRYAEEVLMSTSRCLPAADGHATGSRIIVLNYEFSNGTVARRYCFPEVHESLHQSQKLEMIGQLTGGIAHDFNNLLNWRRQSGMRNDARPFGSGNPPASS